MTLRGPNGDASADTPNRRGRISDALLAQVRAIDPDAVRETHHDGSQYIWLSDGQELPNSRQVWRWLNYSPEAQY